MAEREAFAFSIEETMGAGNLELAEDFLSSDSATTDPEKVKKIEDEPPVKKTEPKKVENKKSEEDINHPPQIDEKKIVDSVFGKDDEKEEEVDDPNKEIDEGKSKEDDPTENTFNALAKDLVKLGVFSQDEEGEPEINTPEEFLERFKQETAREADERITNFLSQFGEDYQHAFQAIFVKGVEPKTFFGQFEKIENAASLDITQESNQIAVLRQVFKEQGLESEDIEAEIERVKNYGDLPKLAERYHKVLVNNEAKKLAQIEQEAEERRTQLANLRQHFQKNVSTVLQEKLKSKEFDGIPLNPKLVQEVQDFLLTDKYKTPSGEKLTEFDKEILELKRPENHAKKVKLALLMKVLENDPTLSTIQRSGLTKKTEALFEGLTKNKTEKNKETNKSKSNSFLGL